MVPTSHLLFRYFLRRRKSAATTVYRVITITDAISCLNAYPVIGTLLNNRDPGPFSQYYFCQFWGITWEPLPYFSVFLVLLISVLRTVGLVKPLVRISKKKVAIAMVVYAVFLMVRFLTGTVLFGAYEYDYTSSYSYIHIHNETYQWLDLYLAMVLLMLPILPIIISAAITSYFVLRSGLKLNAKTRSPQKSSTRSKRHATVTVLIFTLVYIACNIPVTITIVWFSTLVFTDFTKDIFRSLNIALFTKYYIWPTTFVILVQLNAGINPIIYFLRMLEFRSAVGNGGATTGGRVGIRNVVVKFSDSVRRLSSVSMRNDMSVDDNNDIIFVNNQFKLTELPEGQEVL